MPRDARSPYVEPNRHGIFEIRWTDDGRSRRYSTRTRDRGTAEKALAAFLHKRHGILTTTPGQLTAAEILDAYRTEYLLKTVDGKRTASYILPRLAEHFGKLVAPQITLEIIDAYRPQRMRGRKGPVTDTTRRIHLATLSAAYNHAVRMRRITKQETPYIPALGRGAPRERVLAPGEHESIMSAAASLRTDGRLTRIERACALFHCAAYRKMTVVRLTWFQVDFTRGIIDPRTPGRQTRKKKVPVPISDTLRPILERAFNERISEYVLDTPRAIDKDWRRVMQLAGCPDVTPHVYRHTWATEFIASGGTYEEAAKMLGNTPNVVRRNYEHLRPDYLRSAVNFRKRKSNVTRIERVK